MSPASTATDLSCRISGVTDPSPAALSKRMAVFAGGLAARVTSDPPRTAEVRTATAWFSS